MTKLLSVLAACGALMIAPAVASAQSAFTLSGTIIGLRGSGLTLSTNGQNVTIPANATSFTFPTAFASGTVYNVTMTTRPSDPTQGCLIANGRGTLTENVTNIRVACVTSLYDVGGAVSGLRGDGLTLSTNGQTVAVDADGAFNFPARLRSGTAYDVAVAAQPVTPNQRCVATNATGTVTDHVISDIAVSCFSLEVTSSTPAADATDVSRTQPLVLNFSAPLNELTVAPNWVDLLSFPNGHRRVDFSVSGSQLTLTPQVAMVPGTAYTLEVRPGIRAVGGEGLAETVRVPFTTRDAAWQGAQEIAPGTGPERGRANSPRISSNGDTFVTVWTEFNSALGLNRYSPHTGWSTAAILHTGHAIQNPQVFLDDSGTAHVIWEHNDGTLVTSRHTPDAGWSVIEHVPTDGTGRPLRWKGAMDDAGNIFAIWKSEEPTGINSIWVNRYVPGSGWQTPVQLDDDAGGFVTDVGVTVDSVGDAVAYWLPYQVNPRYITSRRYTRSSGWGPSGFASAVHVRDKSTPHLVTWGGETVAVYSREGAGDILAITDRGGWQTPQPIGTGLVGVGDEPRIAFDEQGNVFAAWIQRGNAPTDEVWGNARSAGGVWSTPRRIAVSTGKFSDLGLAMSPNGNPMIVVKDVSATSSRVLTGRYRTGAGWLVETIQVQLPPMSVKTPWIHIDASGSALVVWANRHDGTGDAHAWANVLQ